MNVRIRFDFRLRKRILFKVVKLRTQATDWNSFLSRLIEVIDAGRSLSGRTEYSFPFADREESELSGRAMWQT